MAFQVSIVEIISNDLKPPNHMNSIYLPPSFFSLIVTSLGNEHERQCDTTIGR